MNGTMKKVVLLGSTGSIGTSTLKVASDLPERIQLIGLAGGRNVSLLREQANAHLPQCISIGEECKMEELSKGLHEGCGSGIGFIGVAAAGHFTGCGCGSDRHCWNGRFGACLGCHSRWQGHRRGFQGDSRHGGGIGHEGGGQTPSSSVGRRLGTFGHFPVSGRQAYADSARPLVNSFWGAFRSFDKERFENITVDQALKHPSWVMGRKITIDSATMFNKGLEMIEARWLFNIGMDRVRVVVHPQSVVHSMVEFVDGSMIAQMSTPDMCLPIQYALTYPDRVPNDRVQTDLAAIGSLEFQSPDEDKFPALRLAREAGERCGTLPAVLNAANEVAVQAFCDQQLSFLGIPQLVSKVMEDHQVVYQPDLGQILHADQWARAHALGSLL